MRLGRTCVRPGFRSWDADGSVRVSPGSLSEGTAMFRDEYFLLLALRRLTFNPTLECWADGESVFIAGIERDGARGT
jgi:hypothetical protein